MIQSKCFFNDKQFDIKNIDEDMVQNDLTVLMEYFAGFDGFIGDTEKTKRVYSKLMNFMFISPFMAMLRYTADLTGNAPEYFPIYAVIYGQKSAGKTQFVKTMQTFMFHEKDIKPAPCNTFTKAQMFNSLNEIQGIPVCLDDMPRNQFILNASQVVKCDDELLAQKLTNHGTYIITTNEIAQLKPDLAKRMYFAFVPATQANEESVKKKRQMRNLMGRITGQFYRAYLKEIFPIVNDMIHKMKDFNSEEKDLEDWQPDIFKQSSKVIVGLFEKYGGNVPSYISIVEYGDYFGINNQKDEIQKFMKDEWDYNRSAFSMNRKRNVLEYIAGEHSYDASRVFNVLPEVLEAKCSGPKVIMKLDEAEKFFGIRFRKGFLAR